MTDSSSPVDLERFRQDTRAWLTSNVPPLPEFSLPQSPLAVSTEAQMEWLRAWQAKLYDAGLVGVEWPEEYGGRGLARGHQRIVDQELARAGAPFLVNNVALSWAGPMILHYGTEAQRARFLRPLLRADEIWCQGFSEPEAGSDLASLRTRARREGGGWIIDGHKVWTSLGRFADWMILLARTDLDAPKHAGISYFLSPMRVPGIEVRPLIKITGEGGFNEVLFDGARIPGDALLGQEGQGWALAMATLQFERGAEEGSAGGGGMSDAGLAHVIDLARRMRRDARPASEDPILRDRLAAFAIEATALRYSAQRARMPALSADRPLALPLMQKLTASEHAQRLSDFACEVQGWAGTLCQGDAAAPDGGEWPHRYMNTFGFTIAGGTSEILRNVLGERVLGLPKSR